jgi:hypothetical protein
MAAEKLNRKVSGAFNAVVSAAGKYGLVASRGARLETTALHRAIKLAYNDSERRSGLKTALLTPPIFSAIARRFSGKQLPVEHFDRLLIREFDVTEEIAGRVASYFIEGARQAGILSAGNVLELPRDGDADQRKEVDQRETEARDEDLDDASPAAPRVAVEAGSYSVTFKGPGLSSTVVLKDEDDVAIVEATLKKVLKAIKAQGGQ